MFKSTKTFNGYTTSFRQWKSTTSSNLVHGYSLSFKIWFEGKLDEKNWIMNFDGLDKVEQYLDLTFNNTCIVSNDDPELEWFCKADEKNILSVIVMNEVSCERFAEHVFKMINSFVKEDTDNRVSVCKVECFEDGTKNSAIYEV